MNSQSMDSCGPPPTPAEAAKERMERMLEYDRECGAEVPPCRIELTGEEMSPKSQGVTVTLPESYPDLEKSLQAVGSGLNITFKYDRSISE